MKLPVIVGFGGINAAGRSSAFHAYRRTVIDALDKADSDDTYLALASMMRLHDGNYRTGTVLPESVKKTIREETLIRKIKPVVFDPSTIGHHIPVSSPDNAVPYTVILKKKYRSFAEKLPTGFECIGKTETDDFLIKVTNGGVGTKLFLALSKKIEVSVAGALPSGFDPGALYNSVNHPRGIQMTVYGASDAIYSSGFSPEQLMSFVSPDLIGVYASSSIGQTDGQGIGGYSRAMLEGEKPTSRQMAMGMPQMPADFINAYILGSVGHTSGNIGACATFLYNLSAAVKDIKRGDCRIAVVGCAEAAVSPHIIRAYWAMTALSDDNDLMALDGLDDPEQIDFRRACRPFSQNKGFVLAESAQFLILFDDELAHETGANVYGSVPDVFIHADGFKKSISRPGIGNYICFSKAASAVQSILGRPSLQQNTVVYAHGTGTPQNRVTESRLLSDIANAFDVKKWDVTAIKSMLGHPTGPAGGDQLNHALGIWKYGILPGIETIDDIADDVSQDRLGFILKHTPVNPDDVHSVLINAKGFGGNNATGVLMSPQKTMGMMRKKFGRRAMVFAENKNEAVRSATLENDRQITAGDLKPIYHTGKRVIAEDDIRVDPNEINIPGYKQPISLSYTDRFDA